jgi:hypothetical protein
VSETPDTPAKPETPDVPDSSAGPEASDQSAVTASPDKTESQGAADQTAKPQQDSKQSVDKAKPVATETAKKAEKSIKAADSAKPAKPAPKPKPEDKPFAAFIKEDLLPSLTKALIEREQPPISLALVEGERPVVGGQCWMVQGELPAGRRFWLCFASDAITSGKTIALAESGSDPSLLESFLIDEKRINQALLESRLLQRLNGQKWFGGN